MNRRAIPWVIFVAVLILGKWSRPSSGRDHQKKLTGDAPSGSESGTATADMVPHSDRNRP
jgi:hypothetical protein